MPEQKYSANYVKSISRSKVSDLRRPEIEPWSLDFQTPALYLSI
jgi:hypothetical protein